MDIRGSPLQLTFSDDGHDGAGVDDLEIAAVVVLDTELGILEMLPEGGYHGDDVDRTLVPAEGRDVEHLAETVQFHLRPTDDRLSPIPVTLFRRPFLALTALSISRGAPSWNNSQYFTPH